MSQISQPVNSFFIVDTEKSLEQASADLQVAVKEHGFGVLAIHDLGQSLRDKGVDFTENCHVFEVCNPHQAANVLMHDMSLNMALPCRISIYTEKGRVRIGMIRPEDFLSKLSTAPELHEVARQVEDSTKAIIKAAA